MPLSRKRWLILFVLIHTCAAAIAADDRPSAAALEEASALAAAALEQQQIPGLSLVVMKGEEIILARGFGIEGLGRADPVTEKTVFARINLEAVRRGCPASAHRLGQADVCRSGPVCRRSYSWSLRGIRAGCGASFIARGTRACRLQAALALFCIYSRHQS